MYNGEEMVSRRIEHLSFAGEVVTVGAKQEGAVWECDVEIILDGTEATLCNKKRLFFLRDELREYSDGLL